MEIQRIIDTLRATLDPNQQKDAESYLGEMHKILGFAPALLQIIMSSEMDIPVRQAGVIYLKNLIVNCWKDRESEKPEDPVPFNIHEQDRQHIRERIIEAMIEAPEPIRIQLKTALITIIKHDFPGRFDFLPQKLHQYLNSNDHSHWIGALLALHSLVKTYEYKKSDQRDPLNLCMQHLLPLIQSILVSLLPDNSDYSVAVQKQILKIFYALTQYHLQMDLISKQVFSQWVEAMRTILERPLPDHLEQVDEDERDQQIWWKCKKWAVHVLVRMFERYGDPGNVLKQYNQFSEWYLKSFSESVLTTLLKICESYRQKSYVSDRVMQLTLTYIETALGHAFSWKFLKPHFLLLVQEVIFPLLCHSEKDQELWESDPIEYVKCKYDIFEDMISPSAAAVSLLNEACVKRRGILEKTMSFCMQVINNEASAPRMKDGAFHMIGAVADILLKRKMYKDQMENFLVNCVLPVFSSPEGYRRARACWLTGNLAECHFKQKEVLRRATEACRVALCTDSELPVRIEAGNCMMDLLNHQEESRDVVRPHLSQVMMQLLNLIRETENDDMNTVMQKIVCVFEAEIVPVAEEITQHLADTFRQVMGSTSNADELDEKSVLAMGILSTIETILQVAEEHKNIMPKLEAIVVQIVGSIFQNSVAEFYEEALSLTYSLTCQDISPIMWQIFHLIKEAFETNAFEYFTDMMPALHNYVTVDKNAFLSDPKLIEIVYNMCVKVLRNEDSGEDPECHAAKLLEVMLIDYKGRIDEWAPRFVEIALERLTREVKTSELRTMCLEIVIAAIYYNPQNVLTMLVQTNWPGTQTPILNHFLAQWLNDSDCFLGLHDRKISLLGLCILLNLPAEGRPTAITNCLAEYLPGMMTLFSGLKRTYAAIAAEDQEDNKEKVEDDANDVDYKELESDEDDVDEEHKQYLEMLEKVDGEGNDDDDDDSEYTEDGETALETFETALDKEDCPDDEYIIFFNTMETLKTNDPSFYGSLIAPLNQEQQQTLKEAMELAVKRQQQKMSKIIEQAGGYSFHQTSVPPSFNFGGSFPGANQSR